MQSDQLKQRRQEPLSLNTLKHACEDLNKDEIDSKQVIKQTDYLIKEILRPKLSLQEIENMYLESQKVNPDNEINYKTELENIRLKQQKIKDLEQTLKERFQIIRKMISENTIEKNFKLVSKSGQENAVSKSDQENAVSKSSQENAVSKLSQENAELNIKLVSKTVTQHSQSRDCSKEFLMLGKNNNGTEI